MNQENFAHICDVVPRRFVVVVNGIGISVDLLDLPFLSPADMGAEAPAGPEVVWA